MKAVLAISVLATSLTLLAAGCVGPAPAPPTEEPAPAAAKVTGFAFACPPGATVQNPEGLCVGRIATRTESLQEPYVAVHPTNPDIVAVGINAGHTVQSVRTEPRPGIDLVLLDIYVSEDGGATWRLSRLPYVEDSAVSSPLPFDDGTVVGDPALVFGADGVLHASGIASNSQTRGYNVFYAQTTDLGRSWSDITVLTTDDDNDRNWMDMGPDGTLFVPWQNVGESSEVAWSTDNGATWRTQTAGQKEKECLLAGRMAFWEGTPLLLCGGRDRSDNTGVRILALDMATGDLEEWAELDGMPCLAPLAVRALGGPLVVASGWCGVEDAKVAFSTDGRTFEVMGLGKAIGVPVTWLYWHEADPWGNTHFVVRDAAGDVHHVAFDPVARKPILDQVLRGEAPMVSESAAPAYGDHFYGVAFGAEHGYAVWTRDKGLDFARVEPAWT